MPRLQIFGIPRLVSLLILLLVLCRKLDLSWHKKNNKKLNGERSGERGSQATEPVLLITDRDILYLIVVGQKIAGSPSC